MADNTAGDQDAAFTEARRKIMLKVTDGGYKLWTAAEMANERGRLSPSGDTTGWRTRREGTLMAVRVDGSWRFPDFQFDDEGDVVPNVRVLLRLYGESVGGWAMLDWLTARNRWLQYARPADLLRDENRQNDLVQASQRWFQPGDS